MIVDVTQRIGALDGVVVHDTFTWNEVNTDNVERVHSDNFGGLTIHFVSGNEILIKEDMKWWKKTTTLK